VNTRPHPLFVAAAVPGLLHGAASLYWATGGLWLAGLLPLTDRMGAIGHAAIWDPLFIVWGALLLAALARTRPARQSVGATRS